MNADVLLALLLAQSALGAGVATRLARTAKGKVIPVRAQPLPDACSVTVLVPVLNEHARLAPCLEGLLACGDEVSAVLVIDGGSTDGTQALVASFAARDARIRLLDASPIPPAWNGKAWGLDVGRRAAGDAEWLLTLDADVRPQPALARSLLAFALDEALVMLSVATRQRLATAPEALLHPAQLATLVYRFGAPGRTIRRVREVQANGQCMLLQRTALEQVGGFARVRDSICEDITLARELVAAGKPVGFYEAGALVDVQMYNGFRDAWRNWSRSLPLHDRFWGIGDVVDLLEVSLVQALPLPLLLVLVCARRPGDGIWLALLFVNLVLLAMRVGVLAGTARAYRSRQWTYWLSPLLDLPVALRLWTSAYRRRHTWRGRIITRGGSS